MSHCSIRDALVVRGKVEKFACWPCMWVLESPMGHWVQPLLFWTVFLTLLQWLCVVINSYWRAAAGGIAAVCFLKTFHQFHFFSPTKHLLVSCKAFSLLCWRAGESGPHIYHAFCDTIFSECIFSFLSAFYAVKSNLEVDSCTKSFHRFSHPFHSVPFPVLCCSW